MKKYTRFYKIAIGSVAIGLLLILIMVNYDITRSGIKINLSNALNSGLKDFLIGPMIVAAFWALPVFFNMMDTGIIKHTLVHTPLGTYNTDNPFGGSFIKYTVDRLIIALVLGLIGFGIGLLKNISEQLHGVIAIEDYYLLGFFSSVGLIVSILSWIRAIYIFNRKEYLSFALRTIGGIACILLAFISFNVNWRYEHPDLLRYAVCLTLSVSFSFGGVWVGWLVGWLINKISDSIG